MLVNEITTDMATVNWRVRAIMAPILRETFWDLKRLLFQLSMEKVAEKLLLLLKVFFSVMNWG